MSIASLVAMYGQTMTLRRPTLVDDASGFPTAQSYATTAVRGLLQVLGGSTDIRWGAERKRYGAVCYFAGSPSIEDGDQLTVSLDGKTRTYRVESVRIPDERPSGDPLRYSIAALEEDAPRV